MPESLVCINAKATLDEVRVLQRAFNQLYDDAVSSKSPSDREKVHGAKVSLAEKISLLQKITFPAEAERTFHLREQYESQIDILKRAGFLESHVDTSDPSQPQEIFFIKGIDGKEYLLPSIEDVQASMYEKRSLLEIKADQRFTKLLLVPFAMSLDTIRNRYKEFLFRYRKHAPLLQAPISEFAPLAVWSAFDGGDQADTLTYDPQPSSDSKYVGRSKKDILNSQRTASDRLSGWRVLLVQTSDSGDIRPIPNRGEKESIGVTHPREDIATGLSAEDYLKTLSSESYTGEFGMTPEEWLIASLVHWNQTNSPLDKIPDCVKYTSCLPGAYLSDYDEIPIAAWDEPSKGARLSGNDLNDTDDQPNLGLRTAVRI